MRAAPRVASATIAFGTGTVKQSPRTTAQSGARATQTRRKRARRRGRRRRIALLPQPRPARTSYPESVLHRFWSKVDRRGKNECWPWKAYRSPSGHGRVQLGGRGARTITASRFMWELTHGPVPRGLEVIHRCPNGWCMNPSHLFVGTPADRGAELFRQGRTCAGERHPNSRLTAAQVAEIRALLASSPRPTLDAVAQRYGIAKEHVGAIGKFRLWTRIGGHAFPFRDVRARRPRRKPSRPGRPRCDERTIRTIAELKDGVFSQSDVARLLGVGRTTVGRVWHGLRTPYSKRPSSAESKD